MQTGVVAREKLFNMRMSAEEWDRLDALAQHYNLNAAGVLRMLVKREWDQIIAPESRRRAMTEHARQMIGAAAESARPRPKKK